MELRKRRSKSENKERFARENTDGKQATLFVPKQQNSNSETVRTPTYTTGLAGGGADDDSINTEDAVVGAAVRGGSLLMLLAIIQRASTFILNVLLQRAMLSSDKGSKNDGNGENRNSSSTTSALEEYGAAAITLELISSTALFLAREPFRVALARSCAPPEEAAAGTEAGEEKSAAFSANRARRGCDPPKDSPMTVGTVRCQRRDATNDGGCHALPQDCYDEVVEINHLCLWEAYRRRFVNTAWLSAPIGVTFAAVVWSVYPWLIQSEAFLGVEENRQAATLVCIAAAIELMCEPLALIFQYQLLVGVRVRAEATAVLVLGVSRYLFVAWADVGVLSFGYAQLLHSATLAAAYLLSAARQVTKPGNRTAINPAGADPATETHGVNKCSQVKCASSVGGCEQECSDAAVVDAIDKTTMCSKNGDDSRGSGFALTSGWLPRRPRNSWKLAAGQLAPVGAMAAKSGTIASERSERTQIREQSMKGAAGTAHAAVDYEWVDREKIRLAGAVAGQSVLKHVLTEGDKIVLARASSSFGRVKCSGGGVGSRDEIDGVCENRSSGGGSLYEQGVYAVASGYGSLAARLLFQPLEEAARLMFSKLGAEEDELKRIHQGRQQQREGKRQQSQVVVRENCDGAFDQSPSQRCSSPRRAGVESSISQRLLPVEQNCSADGGGDAAGVPPLVQHKVMEQDLGGARYRIRVRMAYLLATLLKLVLTAGLIFVCFGFHYTETLLRLLLARRDRDGVDNSHGNNTVSEVATVLSWYCVYVLFLAANGMCEAFACAVARGRQLTGMGVGLIASFAAFWALVGPLTGRFGTRGLVMANAAGMACRVICSAAFIRRFFLEDTGALPLLQQRGQKNKKILEPAERTPSQTLWRRVIAGALPHPLVVAALTISSVVAHGTSPYSRSPLDGVFTVGGDGSEGDPGMPWDMKAAAKHVGVGGLCFVFTAAVFRRFEHRFLMELRALWAARR